MELCSKFWELMFHSFLHIFTQMACNICNTFCSDVYSMLFVMFENGCLTFSDQLVIICFWCGHLFKCDSANLFSHFFLHSLMWMTYFVVWIVVLVIGCSCLVKILSFTNVSAFSMECVHCISTPCIFNFMIHFLI